MRKLLTVGMSIALSLVPAIALAHVIVDPGIAGIGQRQVFAINVPTEKDVQTVGIRLVIPGGLTGVMPYAKAGWKVSDLKTGEGEDAVVSEISWTGGTIDSEVRDDFRFQATMPAQPTKLIWKVYQTYQDGSVVSWDMDPATVGDDDADGATTGPYSTTDVKNDLAGPDLSSGNRGNTYLAYTAIAIAVVAFVVAMNRKRSV